jgi:hypothetical protein
MALIGEPKKMGLLGNPRCRRENNIKIDHKLDSSVGIATRPRAGQERNRGSIYSRAKRFFSSS